MAPIPLLQCDEIHMGPGESLNSSESDDLPSVQTWLLILFKGARFSASFPPGEPHQWISRYSG